MGLFSKKKHTNHLFSPVAGKLKSIDKVDDEVFASKAMGDGFAIEPDAGAIFSPITGTVTSVFPTKHAIGLETKDKLEILVHLGIDTVELNGEGFKTFIQEGDVVSPKTKLVDVDLDFLAKKHKIADVIVIFTNLEQRNLSYTEGDVTQGSEVGQID